MRDFADLQNEPGLTRFLDSSLGTLYIILDSDGVPQRMVRRFDRDVSPEWAGAYADLVQAAGRWVEQRPELARRVKIELPDEVGQDFVSRPYHVYYTSTDAYTDWEDPPEPPEELEQMRAAFRSSAGRSGDPKDAVIERVLAKSLLEPTGKTYFDELEGRFIVVDPKLDADDLMQWVETVKRA